MIKQLGCASQRFNQPLLPVSIDDLISATKIRKIKNEEQHGKEPWSVIIVWLCSSVPSVSLLEPSRLKVMFCGFDQVVWSEGNGCRVSSWGRAIDSLFPFIIICLTILIGSQSNELLHFVLGSFF